jgi:HD-GYP domain-containing protein (c-di-GMP phosphodiesterase class II)
VIRHPLLGAGCVTRSVQHPAVAADISGAMSEKAWTGRDSAAGELVERSRERQTQPLARRDRIVTWLVAASFLAAAAPLALFTSSSRETSTAVAILLVLAYAIVSRVQFEVGSGSAVPSQLVLVPMLFMLPAGAVPLFVALGYVSGMLIDRLLGRVHGERVAVVLGSSWHAVGPALVFLLAGEPDPSPANWPVFLAALAAQFTFDFASSTAREQFAVGVPPRLLVRPLAWVFLVDALLAPVGLLAAIAGEDVQLSFLLALPLVGLLTIFARERKSRIDNALALSQAYRGTAMLLGDVVEADDAYTGSHSRDVVDLVLAVCEELRLDAQERQNAEFAALLHDVGKIRIPEEIIAKAGPLTAEERELVNTHTIEGQRLLDRVGGLLAEVGTIVRSCHERVDGRGYPDGLSGDEIPLVARIVACCDAFNAMTTDRPYRARLPLEEAVAELERNAGTQFDSDVVQALVRVAGRLADP